jgi:hypothetical protein
MQKLLTVAAIAGTAGFAMYKANQFAELESSAANEERAAQDAQEATARRVRSPNRRSS